MYLCKNNILISTMSSACFEPEGSSSGRRYILVWCNLFKCQRYKQTVYSITWCSSDRASWTDYILITNLMHWLLFIHKILFSSTCFEHQVLIFRRIQLYTCSIWYCQSLWEFLVACRYRAWVRTDWRGRFLVGVLRHPPTTSSQFSLKLCTDRPPRTLIEIDSTICCMCTIVSSWRWALGARNM